MAYPWPIPPVIGVKLYANDAVVIRSSRKIDSVPGTRTEIKTFSRASRLKLAFVASNTDVRFTSMLTLTYPKTYPNDGKDVKRDLDTFLKALRRKVQGLEYLWFLEFQKRGAPHIHLLLRGVRVYKPMMLWVSQTWYRICDTGDPLHLKAGCRLERIRKENGARNYCVKYAFKMQQKIVPEGYRNVGRFWGHSKAVKPACRTTLYCTNDELVQVLKEEGWSWQRDDVIRWRTLYGVGVVLTLRLERDILELSSSRVSEQKPSL